MDSRKLLGAALVTLPLVAGGMVMANYSFQNEGQKQEAREQGYICPATGEELPCRNCCPLDGGK